MYDHRGDEKPKESQRGAVAGQSTDIFSPLFAAIDKEDQTNPQDDEKADY